MKLKSDIGRLLPLLLLITFGLLLLTVLRTSVFGAVDPEKYIYFEIVFLLLLAVLSEVLVFHFRQPSVMILMVLGILIGPSFMEFGWSTLHSFGLPLPAGPPNILRSDEIIRVFAQLGAVILLFKVGLHSKLEGIFALDNLMVAAAGVLVPFVAGYLYASATGGNFAYSMFLGAALTATSVGVTVALLKEFNVIKARYAQIIVGAAVIDDILGLLVLSVVINLTGTGGASESLLFTLLSSIVFLLGSVAAGAHFVRYLDQSEMGSRRFLLVMALMLAYAYVAEFIHLSAIVGAFLAGLVLNRSRHLSEIEEKTFGLEMLFMPIFFISLGMLVDVGALWQFAIPILLLSLLALAAKLLPCALAARLARLPSREALAVGIGMVPRGEVALIVAAIGLGYGVLSTSQYSIISAMALLTTLAVPPLLSPLIAQLSKAPATAKASAPPGLLRPAA